MSEDKFGNAVIKLAFITFVVTKLATIVIINAGQMHNIGKSCNFRRPRKFVCF